MAATPIMALLILIVFGVAALVGTAFFFRGLVGVPMLSEPRCQRCQYDLRGFAQEALTVCPECGSDLTKPHAVRFGGYQRQPRRMMAGAAIVAIAVIGAGWLFAGGMNVLLRTRTSTARTGASIGPQDLRSMSNGGVIGTLPGTASAPWVWQELDRRYAAGTLTHAEALAALNKYIQFRATVTPGENEAWATEFLKRVANANGGIPTEQYLRLAQAFYGMDPKISVRRMPDGSISFSVTSPPWNLPGVEIVRAVREIKGKDGQALAMLSDARTQGAPALDALSMGRTGQMSGTIPATARPSGKLTFVIDAGVLVEQSVPKLANGRPGQATNWPTGQARWTSEVVVSTEPATKPTISLDTDPAHDPMKTSNIAVRNCRAIRSASGPQVDLDLDLKQHSTTTAMSMDVFLRIGGAGGEEKAYGWVILAPSGATSSSTSQVFVPQLGKEVTAIDVILRPNPSRLDGYEGKEKIDRIWGATIEIPNVPMKRYDLEAEGAK